MDTVSISSMVRKGKWWNHQDRMVTVYLLYGRRDFLVSLSGVNISIYSQILHLGKVSLLRETREEFPSSGSRALCCRELANKRSLSQQETFRKQGNLSQTGKYFPNRETFPKQRNISQTEKHFPNRETFLKQRNISQTGKPFPAL